MDVTSAALSGMQTAALGMAVSSNNVSNASTKDYQAKRMNQQELPQGGTQATSLTASQETAAPNSSNVDYAKESTEQMRQAQSYDANSRVIQTQKELMGTVLNMMA